LSNPLISIIVPAYNHEDYVYDNIKMLSEQTYENLELIIIDDGSKDKTNEQITKAVKKFGSSFVAGVTHISRENMGLCATLNQMIDYAKGDYIYYTASDDFVKSTAIEEQFAVMRNVEDIALVVCDADIIDENSKVVYWDACLNNIYDVNNAKYKTFAEFLKEKAGHIKFDSDKFGSYVSLLKGNYIPNSLLFRKAALIEEGKYNPDIAIEDWYINLQLSKKYKIKYLDKPLFMYRWHSNNSIKNTKKMSVAAYNIIKNEKEYCFSNGLKLLWFKEVVKRYIAKELYGVVSYMKTFCLGKFILKFIRKI